MIGQRRVSPRVLALCVLISLAFLYFVTNSSLKHADEPGRGKTQSSKTISFKRNVDIIVVEEHHEVLEYWFDAANKGVIPKSGNVLLHIDAHSDMAPPEIVENYPVFSWPKDKLQITAMMQSNDVFIQAAAMSGLFKKVIWVWPSWDEDTHDADDVTEQHGGGLTINMGDKQQSFCECEYSKDGKISKCQYINRTLFALEDDYDGSDIESKYCDIQGTMEYQQIVDYNALNKLKLGELVKEGESLLLDIDEDFFGCVLRGHKLVDAGIPWNVVEELNELMDEIFCPKVTKHEAIANNFMQLVLAIIIKYCKASEEAAMACVTPKNPKSLELSRQINRVLKASQDKGIFCPLSREVRQKRIQMLLEGFIRLEVAQIRACTDLGFCMHTSPRSYDSNGFQLCHGVNEPNSTIVTQHSPGENELILRLKRLKRMLRAQRYPVPKLVTLCRSVRDGYTVVDYFEHIEKNVLDAIHKSRKNVNFNVIYDINLLGGKKGWPSRKKLTSTSTKLNSRKVK